MLPKPGATELMCMAVTAERLTPEDIAFQMWRSFPQPRVSLAQAYNHVLDTLSGQRRMSMDMTAAVIELKVSHTPKGGSFYDRRTSR